METRLIATTTQPLLLCAAAVPEQLLSDTALDSAQYSLDFNLPYAKIFSF